MVHSSQSKPLMEKFNLTLDQLDYKYIEKCTNVKQLEGILKVLRSGEEGIYPHLIKFCETKLGDIDPNNQLLHPVNRIMHYKDLSTEERKEITTSIEDWSKNCNENNTHKIFQKGKFETESYLPPVRTQKVSTLQENNSDAKGVDGRAIKKNACTPRRYEDWDKYNVEDELAKIDGNRESESKQEKDANICVPELSKTVSVIGLSQSECERIANLERIKGNEAFKAKDYIEAVIYYSRSLSAFKTASAYNNRAQAHIKLKNYLAAVIDCSEVIGMEPNNTKALFRRGTAHMEAGMYDLASIDFNILLELDPENKMATTKLQEIENLKEQKEQHKSRVVIEELESETENETINNDESLSKSMCDSSSRITIEEVQSNEETNPLLDEICNCAEDNEDIRPLSQKTREMLSVIPGKKTTATKFTTKQVLISEKYAQNSKVSNKPSNVIARNPMKEIEALVSSDSENSTTTESTTKQVLISEKYAQNSKANNKLSHVIASNPMKEIEALVSSDSKKSTTTVSTTNPMNEIKASVSSDSEKCPEGNINPQTKFVDVKIENNELSGKKFVNAEAKTPDSLRFREDTVSFTRKEIGDKNTQATLVFGKEPQLEKSNHESKKLDLSKVNSLDENLEHLLPLKTSRSTELADSNIKVKVPRSKLTPFEFAHMWLSSNANSNSSVGATCLLSIDPEQLPHILTNKLDGQFLRGILMAIDSIIKIGKVDKGHEYLNNLITVPRINLAALFLSNEDKRDIEALFRVMEQKYKTDLSQHRKVLMIQ